MREVTIEQTAGAMTRGVAVVDVRESSEYAAGHVPGVRHIPMGSLADRLHELDRTEPVLVICASGNRSAAMADLLTARGFEAASVAGGTTAWERAGHTIETGWPVADTPAPGTDPAQELSVVAVETPTLGDRTYLVHDGTVGFVVDPQRDIDRITALLDEHGVRLSHVFETHIHNDYVTGGLALARATGATYVVNAADPVTFERTPVVGGETVEVGERMRVTAVATPGHTFTHLSYVLHDAAHPTEAPHAAFTGGSLLFGATGRPDLLGPQHADELARHQHASAHRLVELLPDRADVFPTHGFGSFCAATQSEATSSTIGRERRTNPVLTDDEDTYVRALLDGLGAYPAYYAHMAPANLAGPEAPELGLPATADPAELRRRIEAGEWVVDLRDHTVFAAGHLRGSLSFGIEGSFATYLGWLVPRGMPLTLLADTADDVLRAQRELVRIGIDRLEAHATGGPSAWTDAHRGARPDALSSYPTATFDDLARVRHHRPVAVLDVRRVEEHLAAHLAGATNIALHELLTRLEDVPDGEVWVHCAGGYRASVAASILDPAGHDVVAIDDTFDHAGEVGLELVEPDDEAS